MASRTRRRGPPDAGGGWPALRYAVDTARRAGWWNMWRAMHARNACKTCAVGMGGQRGGMRNEQGRFPEVCKKSMQAMAADLQPGIDPDFFRRHDIEALRRMTPRELEHAGRLVTPMIALEGNAHYRPLDWEDALEVMAARLRDAPAEETFFYVSGRSSNEAGFLLQLFARGLGTNHISNCSYYCHQASGAGLSASVGTGTATVGLDDIEVADLVFLIGGNPASNHPRLMAELARLRRRGGEVVVVNPVRETGLVRFRIPSNLRSLLQGSDIASRYVQPHIGGDIAFLTGVARSLLDQHAIDRSFVDAATEGWPGLREHLEAVSWSGIEDASGVARSQIEEVAQVYARAKKVIFAWTMGITHHLHGVQNVQWITNLALMRGMVGRPGAGLLPIRGHSNVQGMGTMGVTPELKQAVLDRLATQGVVTPSVKGLDTMGCLDAAADGAMRVGWALGGNLYGSNPDSDYARTALGRVDTMFYLSTTLNTGHAHGTGKETLLLPVVPRDEEPHPTTQESMFNFVRLSDGGPPRHAGPRSEVTVITEVARRVLPDAGPIRWDELHDVDAVRSWIARVIPDLEQLAHISRTKREFHIPGRILHTPRFPTPGGRARFMAHPIPEEPPVSPGGLRLMTVRSEGQFNTVVYDEEDIYRGQERRDVILLNPRDRERLGLAIDARVTVRSDTGVLHGVRVREFDIREGNALMYFPEANALVSRRVDAVSRTPAFKSTRIRIELDGSHEGSG